MKEGASSSSPDLPSVEMLIAALDTVDTAVAIIDRQLTVVHANQKFCRAHLYDDVRAIRGAGLESVLHRVSAYIPVISDGDVRLELLMQANRADGIRRRFKTSEDRHLEWRFTQIDDEHSLFGIDSITLLENERQQLEYKSRQFELILNEIAEGVTLVDPDERLVVANGGYQRMYGFDADSLQPGTPMKHLLRQFIERTTSLRGQDASRLAQERLESMRYTQPNRSDELDAQLPDGRTLRISRYRSHEGFLVTTHFDISDQVSLRSDLEQSERRYKGILEAQTELVSRLDANFNIIYANAAYRRTFLPSDDQQIVGRNIAGAFADRGAAESYFARMRALGPDNPVLEAELEQPVADGTLRWHGWTEQALFDHKGLLTGFQSVGRDVTDRKRAEDQLAETLMERNAILDAAFDGIVSIGSNGRIRNCNPAARELLGYTEHEAIGKSIATLFSSRQASRELGIQLNRFPTAASIEFLNRAKIAVNWLNQYGEEIPLDTVLVDASTPKQKLYVAYVRDLRPERAHAARLAEQRDAIAQAEKLSALGTMLANVAHELNNPLAIVLGQATILSESSEDANVLNRSERIRLAAERCANTVKSLLSVSRKRETVYQRIASSTIVNSTLELVGDAIRTSGIELRVSAQDDLPEVFGDATQIGQILSNLLINAQHALSPVRGEKRIEFEVTRNGDFVVFVIKDNGPGIPPEARSRIFEPFFTTKTEGKGTGIGLSIARSLAEGHGGSLSAPPVASGAEMVLHLPVADEQSVPETAQVIGDAPPQEELNARILIVDDESDVAELIADYLMLSGCEVDIATDGEQAMDKLESSEFDAVLTDFRMPGLDGPSLYRRIQAIRPGFERRVGFVTGDVMSVNVQNFIDQNECLFAEKPFSYESLVALVRMLLLR